MQVGSERRACDFACISMKSQECNGTRTTACGYTENEDISGRIFNNRVEDLLLQIMGQVPLAHAPSNNAAPALPRRRRGRRPRRRHRRHRCGDGRAAGLLRRCGTPITCYGCHCSVNELLLASASKMSPPAENLFRSKFRPGECPCGSPSHRLSIAPTKVGGTQWEEVFARW